MPRPILLLPGIRLIESDVGRINMAGGPFAEHFVVGHGVRAQE